MVMIITVGVLLFAVSIYAILQAADGQRDREVEAWQDRLGLVADSRVAAASDWLNRSLNSIEELANDPSLQLYASEIESGDTQDVGAAQRSYIFSLISAVAERSGFFEDSPLDAVAANVRRPNRAGIGIFSPAGEPIVASRGTPVIRPSDWPRTIVGDLADPFITLGPALEDRTPLVLFGAPIYGGEGSGISIGLVGWVVGVRPLDDEFHATLVQPGASEKTAETYVVRPVTQSAVQAITPLAGGGRLLETREDSAAGQASETPGAFVTADNYAGVPVLLTAREFLAPVDWVLVRSVSIEESLEAVNNRRFTLMITLGGAAVLILMVFVLVWRLGISRRLELAYAKEASLAEENKALSDFLTSISNVQPSAMAAVDEDLRVSFANTAMGHVTHLPAPELKNRRLTAALPKEVAKLFTAKVRDAAQSGQTEVAQISLDQSGVDHIYQARFVPIKSGAAAPQSIDGGGQPAALVVMEDFTDLVTAQQRSEKLLTQLVATLTQIIDARDPWSKFHSTRVAEVASAIAFERGLDEVTEETVRIAGQLVNLGKIFVPTDILTKQSPLSEDEYALVRDSLQRGAALVYGLNFRGPVGATLAQFRAYIDGTGDPKGLTGADMLEPAKILAVANAFVGMVSARAHRQSLGFDKSISLLLGDAGTRYDRASVAALANILENKDGKSRWESYTQMPVDDSDLAQNPAPPSLLD